MLRLPTEIRVRIYNFLFGSTPVHIRAALSEEYDEDWRHYRLSVCEHPREHVETPRRYAEWVNVAFRTRIPGCTIRQHHDEKPLSSLDANLGLLQVCRQTHPEASLKPFTDMPFYYMNRASYKGLPGLDAFVEALAPPQLRALSRMRFVVEHVYYELNTQIYRSLSFGNLPVKSTMQMMTGLKDVEIVLSPQLWDETEARRYLDNLAESFREMDWIQTLRELRPKRLRLTVEADFHKHRYEKSEPFPTFASRGEAQMIGDWLRHRELQLHFGKRVAYGIEPVPPYGVQQNDRKVSTPPWATPEGIRKFDLARPEEARLTRLADEEFHATWNAMIKEREKEDRFNPIITSSDFHNFAARQANRDSSGEDNIIDVTSDED